MQKDQKKAIFILFITLFLVMVGFGMVIPIMPFYLEKLGGGPTALGIFMALYSLMQFLFAPVWGGLSDRIGRRPVLLVGLSVYGITFILFGFANSIWMIFITRILSGIFSSATLPTAMAYIADITVGEARSKSIGFMGAAMGVGMIFGPAMGGWLGHFNYALPFFIAGGLALLTFPFAYILLPESLKELGVKHSSQQAGISMDVIHHPLILLFIVAFLMNFSMALFQGTFPLFAADKIGFGPGEMGTIFAIMGAIGVVVQGGLTGKLVARFGDANLVKYGVAVSAIGMVLVIFASGSLSLTLSTAIFSIGNSIMGPSSSALVTKNASGGQGASLGIMQSFGSLGRIIGPVLGGVLYGFNMNSPYLLGAAVMFVMLLAVRKKIAKYDHAVYPA